MRSAAHASALIDARRTHGRRKGVLSVHWAFKVVDGRSTATRALVIMVDRKLPEDLIPARSVIPASLDFPTEEGVVSIPTDVVQCRPVKRHGARVGVRARVRGREIGQLSAVRLEGETGSVYMSGHVAGPKGTLIAVRIRTEDDETVTYALGRVERCQLDSTADSAVVVGVPRSRALALSTPEREIRAVDEHHVGLRVLVLLARKPTPVRTRIHGTGVSARFDDGSVMHELIELEHDVSIEGDSGAPVLDQAARLLGFVIGSNGIRTYVLPAERAFDV